MEIMQSISLSLMSVVLLPMPFYCIRDHKTQPIKSNKSNKCAHVLHGGWHHLPSTRL